MRRRKPCGSISYLKCSEISSLADLRCYELEQQENAESRTCITNWHSIISIIPDLAKRRRLRELNELYFYHVKYIEYKAFLDSLENTEDLPFTISIRFNLTRTAGFLKSFEKRKLIQIRHTKNLK